MTNRNTVFTRTLINALVAAGVRHACVTPGSRNTPLSLAIADSTIDDTSHHDERSAAFFALGVAKTTGQPVVVATTSGTAATELHAAIAEAGTSHVPLIAITADRPTEMYDVAAPQTIDQRNLYGSSVRWAHDMDVPDPKDVGPRQTASLAVRMVAEALGNPPGPVHLNLRFREPLVIDDQPAPKTTIPSASLARLTLGAEALSTAASAVSGRSGVIVAGPQTDRSGVAAIAALGRRLQWPVISDPISGLRAGGHDVSAIVGSDLLAAGGWVDTNPPEVILRFGFPPTSKALRTWMTDHPDVHQLVVASAGWPDPGASTSVMLRADAGLAAASLADSGADPAPDGWLERWKAADAAATLAYRSEIERADQPNEPGIVLALQDGLSSGSALWAASSMPIRDVDSFFAVSERDVAIHANRGANGIDGLISAALGSAAMGSPTVALTGDLSLLHDVGALATMSRLAIPLTIAVVNNNGGGIFHFLPQAGHRHFERHFGTPHGLSFISIAAAFGIAAAQVEDLTEITDIVAAAGSRPFLVEVETDRHRNVDLHERILREVESSLSSLA